MSNNMEGTSMTPKTKRALVPELRFPEFRDAGEWEEKLLDQVCEVNPPSKGLPDSFVYIDLESVEAGMLIQEKVISIDGAPSRAQRLLKSGDVIFQTVRPYQKNNYFFQPNKDFEYVASTGYAQLRAYESNMYLFHYIHTDSFVARVLANCTGSNYPAINSNDLSEITVEMPSFMEQQKIADCLSSIDELITLEARKIDALKAHKKGLMQQLFPAEGETLPELRFPEFRDAGEWEEKKLGEVCHILQGYGFPEAMQGKQNGKIPFFKVSDISRAVNERHGLLSEAANYVDDSDLSKLRAKPIPKGATVFAKIGEALRLNRRAITTSECLVDNNAVGLKAKNGLAADYFIYTLSQLIDLNEYCGGAVPSVNKSTLDGIAISIPSPSEQQKIADFLSSLDDLIALQAQKLDALKAHKKGLLQQLFPSIEEMRK